MFGVPPGAIRLDIRRLDIVHHEVQQGIEPQAVALAVLGGLAALALLVLAGQGLAQLLDRSTPDLAGLRAIGASRAQAALACRAGGGGRGPRRHGTGGGGRVRGLPARPGGRGQAVRPGPGRAGGSAGAGGRRLRARGRAARPPRGAGLAVGAAPRRACPAARASSVAAAAAAAGLPVTAVVGTREALERGAGRRPVPVLATLAGSVVAVMAVTIAVVFGASLTGLVTHPARYGWNWTLLMDSQGGYEQLAPLADGPARQRPAGGHRLVHLRVHPDPHRRPEPARAGADPAPGLGRAPDHQRPPDRRATARSSWASPPCASSASGSGTR